MVEEKKLSLRQQQIFDLLNEGKTRNEVSLALGIEVPTVNNHIQNMYYKMSVSSLDELKEKLCPTQKKS
jgi:DNA-binding NarL/FixJ family response regulator